MQIAPITLKGRFVNLVPMAVDHVHDLAQVGIDEGIWRYMRYGQILSEEELHQWVEELLELQAGGTDLPFTVIDMESLKPIGATRYLEIQPGNRSLEIGGTWYGRAYQGTLVNTECKYMLLKHAFEELKCVRVQFKTDVRNLRSQRAIERLGAVKEGVLRQHIILQDGTLRSSVFFSILDAEWPAVKTRLQERLAGG